MTHAKFEIQLDRSKVDATVKEIESSGLFQCLVRLRELALSDDETALVFEIARRGEVTAAELSANVDVETDVEHVLARMLEADYLLERETENGKAYRLSPKLNPPAPITPDEALDIRRKMTEAGQAGFLESYIRAMYRTLGEEGLKVIGRIMEEKGQHLAERINEVSGQGAAVVGLRYVELMKALGAPVGIIDVSGKEVRFRIEKCAYNFRPGEQGLCDAVSRLDEAIVGSLGCAITFPHSRAKGDRFCEGCITDGEVRGLTDPPAPSA